MTNDTNTLLGSLAELGETMANNLVSMGVTDADSSDGLTTLVGKILSIEPSISGLELDTTITLSSSSNSIISGQSVILTSKLTASYDDETIVDVDLSGVLTGATVLFKEGNNTVGSAVTGSDGICTATINDLSVGSHTLKAVFAGTDNFHYADSSTVTITVTDPIFDGITISNVNDVISYNNNVNPDSTTITAQLTYNGSAISISGETIIFKIKQGSTILETLSDTTDNTGKATVSYEAHGVGNCSIVCECNLLTETYANVLQDYLFFDDASTDKSSMYISRTLGNGKGSTISYSNNEYHVVATGSGTSWYGMSPLSISTSDNTEIKCTLKTSRQFLAFGLADSNGTNHIEHICYPMGSPQNFGVYGYGSPNSWIVAQENLVTSTNHYYKFVIKIENSSVSWKVYDGDSLIINKTYSLPSNYLNATIYPVISSFGNDVNNNQSIYFKEYSVKPLHSINVSATKDILSYADTDNTTLTAIVNHPNGANKSITFTAKNSGGTTIDTYNTTTNSNKVANYEYSGRGIGDVTITIECEGLTNEYSIEDCTFYDTTEYSSGSSINTQNLDVELPSGNYTVEWDSYLSSNSSCNIIVRLGRDGNNFVFTGITGSASYRLFTYQNGSYIEQLTSSQSHSLNTWVAQTVTVENTVVSYKDKSATSNRTFTLDKLLTVITQNSKIKNIKIKSL